MTAFKVTMTPDASDWAEDDIRRVAGLDGGLWKRCESEAEAGRVADQVTALGWTAKIEPMEDGNAA